MLGNRAILLLPLALEYGITELQERCTNRFKNEEANPTLLMLTTAEKLDLKDLREQMAKICARKMPIAELELQKKSIDNEQLADSTYLEVIRYTTSHGKCHRRIVPFTLQHLRVDKLEV